MRVSVYVQEKKEEATLHESSCLVHFLSLTSIDSLQAFAVWRTRCVVSIRSMVIQARPSILLPLSLEREGHFLAQSLGKALEAKGKEMYELSSTFWECL